MIVSEALNLGLDALTASIELSRRCERLIRKGSIALPQPQPESRDQLLPAHLEVLKDPEWKRLHRSLLELAPSHLIQSECQDSQSSWEQLSSSSADEQMRCQVPSRDTRRIRAPELPPLNLARAGPGSWLRGEMTAGDTYLQS